MLNQEQRVEKFFDAINKEAQERHEELTRHNGEEMERRLEKAAQKAGEQAQAAIEREAALAQQRLNRTLSHSLAQQRAALTQRRDEMLRGVVEAARVKLEDFTRGDDYGEFLKKSALRFAQMFDGGMVTLLVRPQDEHFGPAMAEVFGHGCEVRSDPTITIGGCRCVAREGSLIADDTLEKRLEAQRDWFLENCGLSVIF